VAWRWDCEGPEALRCPVCGFEYVHPSSAGIIDGRDNYEAWAGRGDLVLCRFWYESGHVFSLNFGFHKGNTICFWKHEVTEQYCEQCRAYFESKPGETSLCPKCGGAAE
jgi:hypothetical protein